MSLQKLKKSSWMILFIRIDPSCVNQVCIFFFVFFFSCLFSASRLDFVFIFLFSLICFCSSWYLTEIKIYNNQLDQGTFPPSLYLTCFSCCIFIFCSHFSQDIYLRGSFLTLRTMFGLGLGGMYIAWGLCFKFVILLLLKEFHYFHA